MSKRLTFKGSQVRFPSGCLVCQQAVEKTYDVTRTFSYGNRSITITLPMPLCANHWATASKKSPNEQRIGQIGLIAGILAGLGVAIALLAYWSSSAQGNLVMNLFLGAFVGLGAFLAIWALLAFFIAPMFADPDSKAVRNAMKIRHYWPGSQDIQLEFASDAVAELVAQSNADRLLRTE